MKTIGRMGWPMAAGMIVVIFWCLAAMGTASRIQGMVKTIDDMAFQTDRSL